MATNKDTALGFLRLAASGKAREAFATHVDPSFRHHNPYFPGTAEALMTGMDENARQFPDKRLEVKLVLEDGNLAAVYSHVRHTPDELGYAVMHIFRFAGGRIVELWDTGQEVPAEPVNENGMF
jgi:predicted SnoaL-like aldol condensation-catalyzing enzyme